MNQTLQIDPADGIAKISFVFSARLEAWPTLMHIPRYRPHRDAGFNMTPMIDIVFLLIIFFLVSSHLSRQETQLELDLPDATTSIEDPQESIARLTINVLPDGQLMLSGRPVAAGELPDRFETAREKEGDDIEVRIRGSRRAPWSAVEPVMRACTRSNIWNVKWAVLAESGALASVPSEATP